MLPLNQGKHRPIKSCITVGCGSYTVSLCNLLLLSYFHAINFPVVSIWVFCFSLRAGALSNIDGDAINDQAGRGKAALNSQNDVEAAPDWEEASGSGSHSQGTKDVSRPQDQADEVKQQNLQFKKLREYYNRFDLSVIASPFSTRTLA